MEPAPLEIHATGTATTYHPAERGVLVLYASSNSFPTAAEADLHIAALINSVCALIAPYCASDTSTNSANDNTAIAHYSVRSSETSMGRDGGNHSFTSSSKAYKPTFSASASLTIEFRDLALLERLATVITSKEHIKIRSVDWILTPLTRAVVEAQTRKEAARHALQKARDYAEVLGGLTAEDAAAKVRAVLVKETQPYKTVTRAKRHAAKVKGSGNVPKSEWDYEPLDIGVEVAIEGEFAINL